MSSRRRMGLVLVACSLALTVVTVTTMGRHPSVGYWFLGVQVALLLAGLVLIVRDNMANGWNMTPMTRERRQLAALAGSTAALSGMMGPVLHRHPAVMWVWLPAELAVVLWMMVLMVKVQRSGCAGRAAEENQG